MLKRTLFFLISLLCLDLLLVASCAGSNSLPSPEVKVNNAAQALDAALIYLREEIISNTPTEGIIWEESDVTPTGLVGASTKYFVSAQWEAIVSYPIVLPANTIYTVTILNSELSWYWKGEVKAEGVVIEISPFQKMTEDSSRIIAEDFVVNSPTFAFDGIANTLKLTGAISLRCPYCWQFTYEFDSAKSGYGDRTNQMLAEVITHHVAVITIDKLDVTKAVMDDQWDMLQQKMIEEEQLPPPTGVPAAPNNSIVTAKVLDVINVGGDFTWEIVVEVQTSEDVPGFNNATKSRIGETITIKTSEDVSGIEKGQVITANVQLIGDERSRFFKASEIT
jgi:hypothetical protein